MKTKSMVCKFGAALLCAAGVGLSGNLGAAPNYVAHEWGTFTSVQGADGVQLSWNPLVTSDLPDFVHNWPKSGRTNIDLARVALVSKATAMSLQRMETPVIYFYADADLTLNVQVKFPQGTMTEWYPQANFAVPASAEDVFGPKSLRWDSVQVSASVPAPASGQVRVGDQVPRIATKPSHYYAARETEADILRVNGETEKFLFYRGVGNFRAPLTVTQSAAGGVELKLQNRGAEELRDFYVYEVRGDEARFVKVDRLAAGAGAGVSLDQAVAFAPVTAVRGRLGEALAASLVEAGLYAAEARAMVRTWDDSWFGERGLRVLYLLPEAWTDRTLPLSLEPKAAQVKRVMVGRAELITPSMQSDLQRELVRYSQGDEAGKARSLEAVRHLQLGRFLEPAARLVTGRNPGDQALMAAAAAVVETMRKAAGSPGRLAAK